jgi:hypothetical protein
MIDSAVKYMEFCDRKMVKQKFQALRDDKSIEYSCRYK